MKIRVFNLADAGASTDSKVDNAPILQSIIDTIKATPNPYSFWHYVIEVGDSYNCYTPVFLDASNITFRGTKPGVGLTWYHMSAPGIIAGHNRTPMGQAVPADTRVDGFGKMDTTVAPKPGALMGFATHSATNPDVHCHVNMHGTSLSLGRGDGYEKTRKLTIEVAFEVTDWAVLKTDSRPMAGISDMQTALPWAILWDNNVKQVSLRFATSDGIQHVVGIPVLLPDGSYPTGVQRVAFQVDLDAGKVSGFLNRVEVALAKPPRFVPGASFRYNEEGCGAIGGTSFYGWDFGYERKDNGDFVYYGLRLSDDILYNSGKPGQPQARTDGGDVTDYTSYFQNEPSTFFWMKTNDACNNLNLMSIAQKDSVGRLGLYGYAIVNPYSANIISLVGTFAVGNITFENVALNNNADCAFGSALAEYDVRNLRAYRSSFTGSGIGFQSLNCTTNSYPLYFSECHFAGSYAAFYGWGLSVWLNNCTISGTRYGYLFCGSGAYINGGFWGSVSMTDLKSLFRHKSGTNAADLIVRDIQIDHEMPVRNSEGLFWIDGSMYLHKVVIECVDFWGNGDKAKTLDKAVPFVKLDGWMNSRGTLNIKDCYCPGWRSLVVVDNRKKSATPFRWRGRVTGHYDVSKFQSGKVIEYLNGTEKFSYIEVDNYKDAP